jgi:hypothetical protein
MLSRTSDVPIAVRRMETFVSFESSICHVTCYGIYGEWALEMFDRLISGFNSFHSEINQKLLLFINTEFLPL